MSVYRPTGSKKYVYDFQFGGVRFHGRTGKTERKAAERVESRVRAQVESVDAQPARKPKMALNVAASRFYDEVAQHWATAETADYQLENLLRLFGEKLLSEVTDSDVAAYVAKRRGEKVRNGHKLVAPATVNREIQLASRVWRRAQKVWKVAVGEPPEWSQHLLDEPEERIRELTGDEEAKLIPLLDVDFAELLRFCRLTGLRLASAINLRWEQIDYQAMTVTIHGKSKRPGGKLLQLPITRRMLLLLASRRGHHSEFVFTYACKRGRGKHRKGGERKFGERYPFTKTGWRKQWTEALKAAGVRDFRFHDTRHDAATKTLRRTGNLKAVQRMLGHADVTTTAKYAHVMLDDLRAVMEAAHESRESPTTAEAVAETPTKIKKMAG